MPGLREVPKAQPVDSDGAAHGHRTHCDIVGGCPASPSRCLPGSVRFWAGQASEGRLAGTVWCGVGGVTGMS